MCLHVSAHLCPNTVCVHMSICPRWTINCIIVIIVVITIIIVNIVGCARPEPMTQLASYVRAWCIILCCLTSAKLMQQSDTPSRKL